MTNNKKLRALHEYYEQGKSVSNEEIAAIIGCEPDDEGVFNAYHAALKLEWPHIYADGVGAVTEVTEQEDLVPEVHYIGEGGLVRELEVVRIKGNKIYVQEKVEKDLVQIIVKGKTVTIDCVELGKRPNQDHLDLEHNVPVAWLLQAANIAR